MTEEIVKRTRKPRVSKTKSILVPMVRDKAFPSPHKAMVHPDNVKNHILDGWTEVK